MNEQEVSIYILDDDPISRRFLEDFFSRHKWEEPLKPVLHIHEPDNQHEDNNLNVILILDAQQDSSNNLNHFTRPVRIGKIIQRIHHIAKNLKQSQDNTPLQIGPYLLDQAERTLRHTDGSTLTELTDKEFEILLILHRHQGKIVEKERILREIWGYTEELETHTLETHIYRLRQKIEEESSAPEIIQTDTDGYRLV